jgi:hypothetical protein
VIKAVHKECSTVTLDMASQPNVFPVFHTSEIEPYVENDDELFPGRKLECPGPIITDLGEEHQVADIIDQRKRGRGYQYLVRWAGHGKKTPAGSQAAKLPTSTLYATGSARRLLNPALSCPWRTPTHSASGSTHCWTMDRRLANLFLSSRSRRFCP